MGGGGVYTIVKIVSTLNLLCLSLIKKMHLSLGNAKKLFKIIARVQNDIEADYSNIGKSTKKKN